MATVTGGVAPINMGDPFSYALLEFSTGVGPTSSTSFTTTYNGMTWHFTGTGFGSYSGGIPRSGTITGVAMSGTSDLVVTGISVSVSSFRSGPAESISQTAFAGNDNITGSSSSDSLSGYGGNDTIHGGDGSDGIGGGGGTNALFGDGGDDVITTSSAGDLVDGGDGNDTLVLDRGVLAGTLSLAGMQTATGVTLSDGTTIRNTERFNIKMGGSNDNFVFSGEISGLNIFDGGGGIDHITVDLTGSATSWHIQYDRIVDTNGSNVLFINNTEELQITGGDAADSISGTSEADVLSGGGGNDSINSGGGNDLVDGGDGNDVISGDSGTNIISGGSGDDRIWSGTHSGDTTGPTAIDTVDGNDGIDTVDINRLSTTQNLTLSLAAMATAAGTTLGDGSVFKNIEHAGQIVFGSGDDILIVDASSTVAASSASFVGSAGTDRLVGDFSALDTAIVLTAPQDDPWHTQRLTAGLLTLEINTVEQFYVTGGSANDQLYGGAGADVLHGGDGLDVLNGANGNDILNGGTSADTMSGGVGDDVYYVDNLLDVINENSSEGIDVALISVSGYTLGANVEVAAIQGVGLTLTGNSASNILYGASGADTLNGGDGDDTLQGGANSDTLVGGLGNDTFYVAQPGDTVIENSNEGFDATIVQMTTAYTLADNVEVGATFLGSGVNITGNGLDNLLYGNAGADTLNGAGGNDFIQGAGGNDTMAGGTGNDTYFIEDAGDVITENANEGIDAAIVFTSSYTLAANVEVGARFLTTAYTLTGNALDNQLYGNNGDDTLNGGDGNDTIQGGGGNDTMVGGLGNDTYLVEQAGDVVTENANEGSDAVIVLIGSYTLAANVEVGATFLTTGVSITGNGLDNRLYGNSGADTLSGAGGADLLDGGAGADTLTGGSENDTFFFVAGQANGDTITDFDGAGAGAGDALRFAGYGTAAGGATFVQIDATHWQINSADGLIHDTITLANSAGVDVSDWLFV